VRYSVEPARARSLAQALALTIGCFALLSALSYAAGAYVLTHSAFRYSRIAAGNIHVDVMVTGNSRGRDLLYGNVSGSSPTVINLAYNDLDRESAFEWIKTYFLRGNTASTVVIETSSLYSKQAKCDSKPYWVLYPNLYAAQRASCPADAASARYFPLTLFDSQQFLRALYYFAWHPEGDQTWGDSGTIPERLCAAVPLDGVYAFRDAAVGVDRSLLRRQIAQLEQWLASHGYQTRLVFVLAPFFANRSALPAIAQIEATNRDLLAGETSLSLATALGSDCSAFADSVHQGPEGRRRTIPQLFAALGLPEQ
jgi:hypothetical protein